MVHKMPAAKKAKLEKVIKSVDKRKDVLTLQCEWSSCDYVCDDAGNFLVHVSHHIDSEMCEDVGQSSEDTGNSHTVD